MRDIALFASKRGKKTPHIPYIFVAQTPPSMAWESWTSAERDLSRMNRMSSAQQNRTKTPGFDAGTRGRGADSKRKAGWLTTRRPADRLSGLRLAGCQ